MISINCMYQEILEEILEYGDRLETRNHEVLSLFTLDNLYFTSTPLVTIRKTAWKKAIREMEWFLSGDNRCPKELLDWWNGQLHEDAWLVAGYGHQLRTFDSCNLNHEHENFDQIKFIHEALKTNPNSRRLVMTTWNPYDMANITKFNNNNNTPTTCHGTITQFFVRGGKLYIKSYQRSADMLLGVPHNWIQYWAMLLYFAYHSNLEVGGLIWMFGDAHIYNEQSHMETAAAILGSDASNDEIPELIYEPKEIEHDNNNVPIFRAKDFKLSGKVPEPKVLLKPKRL